MCCDVQLSLASCALGATAVGNIVHALTWRTHGALESPGPSPLVDVAVSPSGATAAAPAGWSLPATWGSDDDDDAAAAKLARSRDWHRVHALDLSYNDIGGSGTAVGALTPLLLRSTALTDLKLRWCGFRGRHAATLLRAVARNDSLKVRRCVCGGAGV